MSVDAADVRRIAHLARISLDESRVEPMRAEINGILQWIEQLQEVNVENVEPMTSVTPVRLKMRKDEVTDGGYPERVLANAPQTEDGFFVVPKVVE
jgi:aspartyl-tRNA(Asn)/glutamyl-tRNA(Gln) amidotransferase subunit C